MEPRRVARAALLGGVVDVRAHCTPSEGRHLDSLTRDINELQSQLTNLYGLRRQIENRVRARERTARKRKKQ